MSNHLLFTYAKGVYRRKVITTAFVYIVPKPKMAAPFANSDRKKQTLVLSCWFFWYSSYTYFTTLWIL